MTNRWSVAHDPNNPPTGPKGIWTRKWMVAIYITLTVGLVGAVLLGGETSITESPVTSAIPPVDTTAAAAITSTTSSR